KSTHIQSLINENSLLVSNEIIKQRVNVLNENLVKWGGANTIVTNNDPAHFARLEGYFDVMMVDAPCSGSGLFRRDENAIEEWSPNNVALCSQRQQRILADAWPSLKEGGILIYSTCSYSRQENEHILDWLAESFSVESLPIDISDFPGIVSVGSPIAKFIGYRFYPDKIEGEGFFIAVLRKTDGTDTGASPPKKKTLRITANELSMIQPWLTEGIERSFFKQQDDILALPASFENDLVHLQQALYIRKAGLVIGKTTVKDLVPDHQLAMSSWVAEKINSIELPYTQAIQYLRKDEVHIEGAVPGWNLVKFNGHNLGWAKILANRTNNYYPKEWRILKKI
ncbi:MAG: RNA methyltransferase, partial [Gemmatimonadaceae bacterium]|nr:RNA methyltransferase [Chitinophagaceae bacterium]